MLTAFFPHLPISTTASSALTFPVGTFSFPPLVASHPFHTLPRYGFGSRSELLRCVFLILFPASLMVLTPPPSTADPVTYAAQLERVQQVVAERAAGLAELPVASTKEAIERCLQELPDELPKDGLGLEGALRALPRPHPYCLHSAICP